MALGQNRRLCGDVVIDWFGIEWHLNSAKFVQQRLGVLQVGGVEALGEPVVDVREHRARWWRRSVSRKQPRGTLGCELNRSRNLRYVMMVLADGGERTQEEFADLFSRAGLKLIRVVPTPLPAPGFRDRRGRHPWP